MLDPRDDRLLALYVTAKAAAESYDTASPSHTRSLIELLREAVDALADDMEGPLAEARLEYVNRMFRDPDGGGTDG